MRGIVRKGRLFASEAEANASLPGLRKRKSSVATISTRGVSLSERHSEPKRSSKGLRRKVRRMLKEKRLL